MPARRDPRKYQQIANELEARITDSDVPDTEKLRDGEALPTIGTLAKAYGVSTDTVQAAMAELARRGLAERVPGLGWFVFSPPPEDKTS